MFHNISESADQKCSWFDEGLILRNAWCTKLNLIILENINIILHFQSLFTTQTTRSLKTISRLFSIVNAMTADGLAVRWTRVSAAMFSGNVSLSIRNIDFFSNLFTSKAYIYIYIYATAFFLVT